MRTFCNFNVHVRNYTKFTYFNKMVVRTMNFVKICQLCVITNMSSYKIVEYKVCFKTPNVYDG